LTGIEPSELAYWGGFFDGEGSISIYRYQNKSPYHVSPTYSVQMSLSQVNKQIVDLFSQRFKGTRAIRKHRIPNARTQYYWSARGRRAIAVIKELLPFLRLKRSQADLALEFHTRKGANPSRHLTEQELRLREEYYQRMHQLNVRGRHNG